MCSCGVGACSHGNSVARVRVRVGLRVEGIYNNGAGGVVMVMSGVAVAVLLGEACGVVWCITYREDKDRLSFTLLIFRNEITLFPAHTFG